MRRVEYPVRRRRPVVAEHAEDPRRLFDVVGLPVLCGSLCGGLWDSLGVSGTLWDSLGLSGTLWDSLGLSGTLWVSLGLSGGLWESLGLSGTGWPPRPAGLCGFR